MEDKQQHTPETARQKLYDEIERAIPTIYNDHLEIGETDHTTIDKIMGLVDGYLFAQSKAHKQRIASLTEQVEQKWHEWGGDKTPEEDERILCLMKNGQRLMGKFVKGEVERFVDQVEGERVYKVYYNQSIDKWQPLPPIPAQKEVATK